MSDLAGNPEDRFSHNKAHIDCGYLLELPHFNSNHRVWVHVRTASLTEAERLSRGSNFDRSVSMMRKLIALKNCCPGTVYHR